MRFLTLLLTSILSLYAFNTDLRQFEADFEQRITDEDNQTLIYRGHVWADRSNLARWRYDTPVVKEIYIQHATVVILEPDLEQAIVRPLDREIDFLSILAQAKRVDDTLYTAYYASQTYTIHLDNEQNLDAIRYRDGFENRIELRFSHQKRNEPIDSEIFKVDIPADFDVIR